MDVRRIRDGLADVFQAIDNRDQLTETEQEEYRELLEEMIENLENAGIIRLEEDWESTSEINKILNEMGEENLESYDEDEEDL